MLLKRVAAVVAFVLGCVGMVGCLAGAYGVWQVQSRLEDVNDRVFGAVDRRLAALQDRIPVVQTKVKDARLTMAEVTAAFQEWGAKQARERIVSQLQIESRTEKLSERLQTLDLMLDASHEAIHDVQQMLEVSQSLGVRVDPASLDAVLERLVSLRESLRQTERAVDGVRQFAEGDPVQERLAKAAKLAARILLTLSEVEDRLDDLARRLAEVRTQAELANARTSRFILWGSAVCYCLLAWMGAGQATLCWWGRSRGLQMVVNGTGDQRL
jgi:hypothetical protein